MEKFAKANRQKDRQAKNLSKSVRLDAKKGMNRLIKGVKKKNLSPEIEARLIKIYEDIKLTLKF